MNKLSRYLLFFLLALLALQFFIKPAQKQSENQEDLAISGKEKLVLGQEFRFTVKNNSEIPLPLRTRCQPLSFNVTRYENGVWQTVPVETKANCQEEAKVLTTGQTTSIDLTPWAVDFFQQPGKYRLSVNLEEGREFNHEFSVKQASIFRKLGVTLFYRPILNGLVFLISLLPGHELGWAIIVLTLIIKLILLGPNQKALKAQKKMQLVQPELDALKMKYKEEPQVLAQKSMEVWKKHKVSPASSCLPMLIQLPIMIALFYVVRSDVGSAYNALQLYEVLKGVDLSLINSNFLGIIDLHERNVIVLPLIVGLLQFAQMKMTVGKQKIPETQGAAPNPAVMMNKMMVYMMPVMIAVFTASLPAAVGFYWGASTLFGIGQQMIVNRSKE